MKFTFNTKQAIFLSLGFVFFTIFGTLSHEYGHILIAKYLGFDTTLFYGRMIYHDPDCDPEIFEIYSNNKYFIDNGVSFPEADYYNEITEERNFKSFLVILGGPIQTMLTGTLGIVFLFFRRKNIVKFGIKFIDWIFVFLTLFWLRPIFNFLTGVISETLTSRGGVFNGNSDEIKISHYLNLYDGFITILTSLLGLLILSYLFFIIIPRKTRFTLLLSGFFGSLVGYVFWFKILGPVLLPY
ncbi:hypothetical protein [Aureivirga sp. CE67]|uniref:hypothetical protein n=1 Tax=Aureivirga sp. CE67 TaxID=1788983 RepID=UPI0018C95BC5|nr:hypothetical protein [Aureivirga sp. CE67]